MRKQGLAAHPSTAELNKLVHELAAKRNMAELLFHVALKAEQLSRSNQLSKMQKVVDWRHAGSLCRFGRELELVGKLQPELSGVECVALLDEHGLLPRDLMNEITLGEAIAILSTPLKEVA